MLLRSAKNGRSEEFRQHVRLRSVPTEENFAIAIIHPPLQVLYEEVASVGLLAF